MIKRFDFRRTICERSVFEHKKIDEKDLELLRHYNIKNWNDEDFDEELLLKWGTFIISKNRDMFLKPLGGGSFEIPEMYAFIYRDEKIHIESGGGGKDSKIFKKNNDGSYDEEIIISRIDIPGNIQSFRENAMAYIAEALAVMSFRSPQLNRLSIVFEK